MAPRKARRPATCEGSRCAAGVCAICVGWRAYPDLRPPYLPDAALACAPVPWMRGPARDGSNDACESLDSVEDERRGGRPCVPAWFPNYREACRVGVVTGRWARVSCVEARGTGGFGLVDAGLGTEIDLRRTLMAAISCPKCNTLTERAGYPAWVIILCICLFPVGLFALLAGRKPTTCGNCRFTWQA